MPKLIVSTVASGDTAPYVGETDITMMYSIVDIAGKNGILDGVLDNAAGGIVGMARAYRGRESARSDTTAPNDEDGHISESDGGNSGERTKEKKKQKKKKVKVGITMFGVTTPCVDAIRSYLCPDPSSSSSSHLPSSVHEKYIFEPFIFHATGHGGRAMECLIASSNLDAVIDLTTSEIADEIVGGVMTAGPDRLRAAAERGIPQVISLGACDMVNFGPRDTLPRRFVEEKKREIYEHNSSVTLVRTNAEECRKVGEFISGQLRKNCKRPELVEVIVPTGGLSVLSVPGGVYEDKEADEVLFRAVEEGLEGSGIMVVRDKRHVNDEGFAREVAERLVSLIEKREEVDREGGDESGAGEKR